MMEQEQRQASAGRPAGWVEALWRRRVVVVTLAVSVGAHVLALLLISLPAVKTALATPTPHIIELVNVPAATPPVMAPAPEEKPPEPKPPERLKGQIVDLGPADPNDTTPPPEDARYLSERNLRTDRESVKPSRARTGSPGNPPEPTAEKAEKESGKEEDKAQAEKKAAQRAREKKERGDLPEPARRRTVPVEVAKNDAEPGEAAGDSKENKDKKEGPSKDELKVTMSDLNKALDADDGSIDFLPDVPRGDVTVLNSKQFTYAAFFNRMKKVIRFHWEPMPALQAIGNPNLKISATFWIVVKGDGSLDSVEVLDPSGYPIWDAAAIKAVRQAAPFYNVPQALLDENGAFGSKWTFLTY